MMSSTPDVKRNTLLKVAMMGALMALGVSAGCHEAPAERQAANERRMWFTQDEGRANHPVNTPSMVAANNPQPATAPATAVVIEAEAETNAVRTTELLIEPAGAGDRRNAAAVGDPQLKPNCGWVRWRTGPSKSDPLLADPPADAATILRGYRQTVCVYENDAVPAGPIYMTAVPNWGKTQTAKDWIAVWVTEPPFFVFDALAAPFRMIAMPPLTPMLWHDATNYPPSYTVAPPAEREKARD